MSHEGNDRIIDALRDELDDCWRCGIKNLPQDMVNHGDGELVCRDCMDKERLFYEKSRDDWLKEMRKEKSSHGNY